VLDGGHCRVNSAGRCASTTATSPALLCSIARGRWSFSIPGQFPVNALFFEGRIAERNPIALDVMPVTTEGSALCARQSSFDHRSAGPLIGEASYLGGVLRPRPPARYAGPAGFSTGEPMLLRVKVTV